MQRLTLRFGIAILTFIIGITLTSLWLLGYAPTFKSQNPVAVQPVNPQVNFRITLEQHQPDSHYYHYLSDDGLKLMTACIRFSSVERANMELQYRINSPQRQANVIERSPTAAFIRMRPRNRNA
jgi:hypothetical protein